jgi:hypothetical protein
MLSRPDRSFLHDALYLFKPIGDFGFIGSCAIAAEQKLTHVRRHGVLAAEALGEVFTDDVALESHRR